MAVLAIGSSAIRIASALVIAAAALLLIPHAGRPAYDSHAESGSAAPQRGLAAPSVQVAQSGARLAAGYRCGACHIDLPTMPATPLPQHSPMQVLAVLRPGTADHVDFGLAEGEALAVALAVATAGERGSTARELQRLRRQHPAADPELGLAYARGLNCGGCHEGLPGAPGAGPPLIPVVEGSRAGWLHDYLRRPAPIRPFGTRPGTGSRMPDFRLAAAEIDSLAAYLQSRADRLAAARAPLAAEMPPTALTERRAATADTLLDRLSCRGCHVYRGRGGRIGPGLDDVLRRRTPDYIGRIIRDPALALPGAAMPRPLDVRVERVIALLATGEPRPAAGDAVAAAAYLSPLDHALVGRDDGSTAGYMLWCAACHGAGGNGDGYNARYLTVTPAAHADAGMMARRPDDTLHDGIAAGGHALGRSPEMPAFAGTLEPARIHTLVRYLRTLCACTQPAWAARERR